MRRLLGIAAICLVLGCGADGASGAPVPRLDGLWVRDDGPACIRMLGFEASNGVLVNQRICDLTDGTIGTEIHVSSFDADSDSITVYPEESSCAGVSREPHVLRYQLDGAELILGMPEGVVAYEKNRDSRADGDGQRGGAATFGCFDEADFFEPRALQPI
jgi:hypothetical protein